MSDLLTRLAQRALGAAPAVQPLLRSRYEAPAPGFAAEDAVLSPLAEASPPAVAEPGAQEASTHSPQDARTPRTVVRRSPSPEAIAVPPPPAVASTSHVHAVDDGLLLPVAPDERLPVRASAVVAGSAGSVEPARQRGDASGSAARHDSAPTPAPLPHAESSTPAAFAKPRGRAEAGDAGRAPRPRTQPSGTPGEGDDDLLFPLAASADGTAGEPDAVRWGDDETGPTDGLVSPVHGVEANDPDGTREPRATPARNRPMRPAVAARAAAQPGRGERPDRIGPAESGEEARPVVRVTIGRIEVRAVTPPPAPPAAARAAWTPPVLSLGDYLKRGSGR